MGETMAAKAKRERDLVITIKPGMLFGAPAINGKRIAVEQVAAMWWADNMDKDEVEQDGWPVANWNEVKLACWYMAEYGTRLWKKRYGNWARQNSEAMWHSEWDSVPMPPQMEREKVEVVTT